MGELEGLQNRTALTFCSFLLTSTPTTPPALQRHLCHHHRRQAGRAERGGLHL